MKRLVTLGLVALVALAFGPTSHAFASVAAQGKVVRITLIDENGSGEDGSAQLTDMGDGTTKVELIMLNAPEGAEQPAHIHKGTCTTLDPSPAFPLETVKEGKSTTIVKTTLADLTKEKYAINVHKSAAEASIYVSCGNLPSAAAVSGQTMTLDQALEMMLDQATEILGNVQKKEADASKNAYDAYHATFAANEEAIKTKDAATQTKLEDAMHEVRDTINEGKYDEAAKAAQELIDAVKAAQTKVGGGDLTAAIGKLQAATADLVRETANKDKEGSQRAYDDFHTLFAANEEAIKDKNAEAQEHIEEAMHEVRDALAAGDFAKANTASTELQKEVNDAAGEMGMTGDTGNTGGTLDTGLEAAMQKLQTAIADLVRETSNKDKDGSQKAYNDYHDVFAANEAAIQAKDNATWQELEDLMHEVRDAVNAGDLEKANTASKELQQALSEADAKLMGGQGGTLPNDGAGDTYLPVTIALSLLAFGFIISGGVARRRATR
jgi:hypothetical protein